MERVVLTVEDDPGRRKVAFQARLVGTQFVQRGPLRGDWSVYLTGQGRLVAYEDEDQHLFVYEDFSELERVFKDEAPGLLVVVAEGLGQEYVQELVI
jgi:hypothetical protein